MILQVQGKNSPYNGLYNNHLFWGWTPTPPPSNSHHQYDSTYLATVEGWGGDPNHFLVFSRCSPKYTRWTTTWTTRLLYQLYLLFSRWMGRLLVLPSDGQARTLWKSPGCTWNQRWKITMEEPKNPSKIELVDTQVFFGVRSMGSVGDVLDRKTSSQPRMNKITRAGMNPFLKENLGHIIFFCMDFPIYKCGGEHRVASMLWSTLMIFLCTNIYQNTRPNVDNYSWCMYPIPIASMYGIFTYIYQKNQPFMLVNIPVHMDAMGYMDGMTGAPRPLPPQLLLQRPGRSTHQTSRPNKDGHSWELKGPYCWWKNCCTTQHAWKPCK